MTFASGSGPQPDGTNYHGGVIQSPELNKAGKPTQRSIRDIEMARQVVNLIIQAGRNRSIVNSRIQAKINAERPYDAYKLQAEGLDWKQNFTTKPLPALVEKVAPRFVGAVNDLKYLTNSSLPASYDNATEKSERFREEITKTIRTRKGWKTLLDDIAFNNALFGYTAVAWMDEYCWFPMHFQQDQFFLPDGTKQEPRLCQVVILKEVLLPHELYAYIEDREFAEIAGWNLQSSANLINNASPQQVRDRLNVGGTLEFWYQNAIRELTIGASYMAAANVVVLYHLFAREVTGKVSHYIMGGQGLDEVFTKEDQFESMEDCVSFFSFQKGNGTMHGSKGIGRDLYELAGMIDRSRNEVVDRSIMAGKILIKGDIKRLHTFKMSVVGMTCIIPNGWDIQTHKLDGDIEPFIKLDQFFGALADQLIGNTSVPQPTGGEAMRSPAAWNVITAREEEGKDVRIGRFLEQATSLFQTMQRRLCNPDTTEDDAKETQKRLKEFLSAEEMKILANQPVAETVRDMTPVERQMIAALCQEKKGNPAYNQRALEVEDLNARANSKFREKVLLPGNDRTEEAEQQRLQQFELNLIQQGQAVPVSARDNHLIHLSILMPVAQQLASAMMAGQQPTHLLEVLSAHIVEHLNAALSTGVPKEKLTDVIQFEKNIGPALAKLKELDQSAAQQHAAAQQHNAESAQHAAAGGLPATAAQPQ